MQEEDDLWCPARAGKLRASARMEGEKVPPSRIELRALSIQGINEQNRHMQGTRLQQ